MIIIEIAGRLGADPETRFTTSGLKVTNLRVATNIWKSGKEETVWWRVTVWGDRFDKMLAHLKKGSAVIIIGEMHKPEIFTNRDGNPQISMEMTAEIIKFSPFGNKNEEGGQGSFGQQAAPTQNFETAQPAQSANATVQEEIPEEDLPF